MQIVPHKPIRLPGPPKPVSRARKICGCAFVLSLMIALIFVQPICDLLQVQLDWISVAGVFSCAFILGMMIIFGRNDDLIVHAHRHNLPMSWADDHQDIRKDA